MLTPPDGLDERDLGALVDEQWGVRAASIRYLPVGFGSHHWHVIDETGGDHFVTVDELDLRRRAPDDTLDDACRRLRSALGAASEARAAGAGFVVAPTSTHAGAPIASSGRFAVAVYPFVAGAVAPAWGSFLPGQREAVGDLVAALHSLPTGTVPSARTEDFVLPHRVLVEAVLAGRDLGATGPHGAPVSEIVHHHAAALRRLFARHDVLVATAGHEPRFVLTHGEPHPGNSILTTDGYVLVDWDTALLAPPERDLWHLDPGGASALDAYAAATGTTPRAAVLELYRIRWDLADLAEYVNWFARPHAGTEDDAKSYAALRSLLGRLAG